MEKVHWKQNSISVPFGLDYLSNDDFSNELDLESSLPLYLEERQIQRRIFIAGKKKSTSDESTAVTELSTDEYSPGVLKIFGDKIVPGVEYKSVLASKRSTAQELMKQALERYGLQTVQHSQFVLCDVIGSSSSSNFTSENSKVIAKRNPKWRRVCSRVISEYDRPLLLQNYWKPGDGYSRRYELRRKSEFSAIPSEDDTIGLNANARKISMSKLRPGAIPTMMSWQEQKFEKFADELNLDGSISRINSPWMITKKENNKVLNGLDLQASLTTPGYRSPIALPNKNEISDNMIAPSNRPFLLTIRGFDSNRDSLFYLLQSRSTLVCNAKEFATSSSCIGLYSPDINQKHCHLHLRRLTSSDNRVNGPRYNYCLEIECIASSNIRLNGHPVFSRATVQCGDILTIGSHYMFVFKDLTSGCDIPTDLPWGIVDANGNIADDNHMHLRHKSNQNVVHVPPLMLGSVTDDSMSVSTVESNGESTGERFRFAYSREKEEEIVKAIGAIIRQNYVDFPLAPAYLYSMCIEFTCHQFDRHQVRNLLLRILVVIRESVAGLSKALQNNKFNCGLIKSKRHNSGEDYLKCLVRWMSNCVQIVLFLRGQSSKYRGNRRVMDDDLQAAFHELASGLEEIVVFCFQQAIYTITKALYMLIPAILDSNPFSEHQEPDKRSGVWKITAILDIIERLTNSQQLHTEVTKQLFMYIFFFCSTSVFNRLFLKDAGNTYYNWTAGVRIRANLGELEDWATRNGLDEEFSQLFEKLLTAAEFLSTSKTLLLKYDWMNMRVNFHPLNEAQLHRLLSGYNLGGRPTPYSWNPPPEDHHQALQEDEILLEMSGHPPFLFPQDYGIIDLVHPPDDKDFWDHFKELYSRYGVAEDDSDLGSNASHTPRFNGNFPKVELQKSFFCQSALKPARRSTGKPSPRKVSFATTDAERANFREQESKYDVTLNENLPTDSVVVRENLVKKSGISWSRSVSLNESPDKRLDELITNSAAPTSVINNPNNTKGDVHNIRCLSPPPLPPRNGRESVSKIHDSSQIPTDNYPSSENQTQLSEKLSIHHSSSSSGLSTHHSSSSRQSSHNSSSSIGQSTQNSSSSIGQSIHNSSSSSAHCKGNVSPNEDICGEYVFPKELLVDVNKQILDTQQKQRSANMQRKSSSPDDDVFLENGISQESSPRSTSNPVFAVNISKGDQGLGLGLIDGLYTPLRVAGIYIRKILPNSPAAEQGQISIGDRLLCVNGKSIVGADYQSAMKLIRASGESLILLVAKGNSSIAAKVSSTNC